MVARIIAVANRKGGVGKTTLTLSFAEGLAALKKARVLVVDLDAQINVSTLIMGGKARSEVPWKTNKTIVDLIEKSTADGPISTDLFICKDVLDHTPGETVSLLSGDPRLMGLERRLLVRPKASIDKVMQLIGDVIDTLIEEHDDFYHYIIFDCPPGFSLTTDAALRRADMVVLPTSPTNLASQGIQAYVQYLQDDLSIPDAASRTWVFLTMTGRTNSSRQFEGLIRAEEGKPEPKYRVFNTSYAYSVRFQEATDRRDQRMVAARAVWRSLDRMRGRALFHRLYGGIWQSVDKAVAELVDILDEGGRAYDRNTTRPRDRRHLQHEARA